MKNVILIKENDISELKRRIKIISNEKWELIITIDGVVSSDKEDGSILSTTEILHKIPEGLLSEVILQWLEIKRDKTQKSLKGIQLEIDNLICVEKFIKSKLINLIGKEKGKCKSEIGIT